MSMQSLLMSYAQGWNPSLLTAVPRLWLDDSSPMTLASGAVSVWGDRSGNAWDVSQTTAANRPTPVSGGLNGRRTVLFDGVNDVLQTTATAAFGLFQNRTYGYMFSVVKKTAADGSAINRIIASVSRGGSTPGIRAAQYIGIDVGGANVHAGGGRRLDTDSFGYAADGAASAGTWYMRLDYFRWADRQVDSYLDGQLIASGTSLWTGAGATSNTISTGPIGIGGAFSSSGFSAAAWADVEIACSLMGNSQLSTDDVDRLFGWAAWRYGLQSSLPSGHPYKNSPP
uniref:hypothetical protein n=1 Tax=Pseudomonas sp. RW407 TaxID=2202894 RepID=UPI0011B58B61|nr:hypothetical protein [Pseudomonas sp. RW407]